MLEMILQNSVVIILFTLGVLIFIHELGHYLVGVMFKMGVISFSIGFGPKIFSWKRKDTEFRLGLIPLGGYVQFAGALPHEQVPPAFVGREIYRKPIWQRALMVLAGPVANLLLAGGVFALIAWLGVPTSPAIVGVVAPDSRAARAGIQVADEMIQYGQRPIRSWADMVAAAQQYATVAAEATLKRQDQIHKVIIEPGDGDGKLGIIYGFLAPLVVVQPASLAAELGLPPVFKIRGIELTSASLWSAPEPVRLWHEVVRYLDRLQDPAAAATVGYLHLQYVPQLQPDSPEDQGAAEPQLRSVSMKLTAQQVQQAQAFGGEQLLAQLGISPAQLMVVGVSSRLEAAEMTELQQGLDTLRFGDVIQEVNGEVVRDMYHWYELMLAHAQQPTITVLVQRDGHSHLIDITQYPRRQQRPEGAEMHYIFPYQVGESLILPPPLLQRASGVLASLHTGMSDAWRYSYEIMRSLGGMVVGAVPVKALGGPILIAQVARESAARGLVTYLTMLALISLNLFLINLVPIPVLDGGQLVLLGMEAARGGRLPRVFVEKYQAIGFVLILALIILATYNDVSRYWLAMIGGAE